MSTQRVSLDMDRVLDPAAWEGAAGEATMDHVRAAVRALARKHDIEVDEVVSMVWLHAQEPSVRNAREPRAVLLTALCRSICAAREGEHRMVSEETARRPHPSPRAQEAKARVGEVASLIAQARQRGDTDSLGPLLAAHDEARASLRLAGRVVRMGEMHESLLPEATPTPAPGEGAGLLGVAVDALVEAGWSRQRAWSVVEAVAASAGGEYERATGSAQAAKRLGSDETFAGHLGLSLSRWRAVVELIVGSSSTPGVVARVALGEPAEHVLADPRVRVQAARASGRARTRARWAAA